MSDEKSLVQNTSMSEGYAEIYDQAKDYLRIETNRFQSNGNDH